MCARTREDRKGLGVCDEGILMTNIDEEMPMTDIKIKAAVMSRWHGIPTEIVVCRVTGGG